MKYLRRELNQVEKEYLKQFGEDSLNRVILHDPNTKDKQEVQDTIERSDSKKQTSRTSTRGYVESY